MGPTYLVLLCDVEPRSGERPTILYNGRDEAEARRSYDYAVQRGIAGATAYLTTVRAEAKLS